MARSNSDGEKSAAELLEEFESGAELDDFEFEERMMIVRALGQRRKRERRARSTAPDAVLVAVNVD